MKPIGKPTASCIKARLKGLARRGLVAGTTMILLATPVLADLKICNATPGRVGVALGYQDSKGWATEGWWNIPSKTCENLLKGALPSRFLYVYAIDYERGGDWSGKHYMCTGDKSFTIRDNNNCESRGYQRRGFYEIDTGTSTSWTVRLSDPEDDGTSDQPANRASAN